MKKLSLVLCLSLSLGLIAYAEQHPSMLSTTHSNSTATTCNTTENRSATDPATEATEAQTATEAAEQPDVLLPPGRGQDARRRTDGDRQVRPGEDPDAKPQPTSRHRANFEDYLKRKCDFVIAELGLTPAEVERFLPVYRELQQSKSAIYRRYGGNRDVRRRIAQGEQVPDSTLMRVVNNTKQRELEDAQLEQQFVPRLAKVLTPLQLVRLGMAEQKFQNEQLGHSHQPNGAQSTAKPIKK